METNAAKPSRSPPIRDGRALDKPRRHRAAKIQPLTRSAIDGRTNAAKQFDAIAEGIATDLGGRDRLSTVEAALIEAFAGATIHVNQLNSVCGVLRTIASFLVHDPTFAWVSGNQDDDKHDADYWYRARLLAYINSGGRVIL